MINEMNSVLDEAIKIAQKNPIASSKMECDVLKSAERNNQASEMGNAYYCMAYACRIMSDSNNGLNYAFKALDIFEALLDSKDTLKVRNIIGEI